MQSSIATPMSTEARPAQFVSKRELALIVERYLKEEKLTHTLKAFQDENAKLLRGYRPPPTQKVKSLESIVNEYICLQTHHERKHSFVSSFSGPSTIRATMGALFDLLDDYSSIRNDPNFESSSKFVADHNRLAHSSPAVPAPASSHYHHHHDIHHDLAVRDEGFDDQLEGDAMDMDEDSAEINPENVLQLLFGKSEQIAEVINSKIVGEKSMDHVDDVVNYLLDTMLPPAAATTASSSLSAPSSPIKQRGQNQNQPAPSSPGKNKKVQHLPPSAAKPKRSLDAALSNIAAFGANNNNKGSSSAQSSITAGPTESKPTESQRPATTTTPLPSQKVPETQSSLPAFSFPSQSAQPVQAQMATSFPAALLSSSTGSLSAETAPPAPKRRKIQPTLISDPAESASSPATPASTAVRSPIAAALTVSQTILPPQNPSTPIPTTATATQAQPSAPAAAAAEPIPITSDKSLDNIDLESLLNNVTYV